MRDSGNVPCIFVYVCALDTALHVIVQKDDRDGGPFVMAKKRALLIAWLVAICLVSGGAAVVLVGGTSPVMADPGNAPNSGSN